MGLSVEFEVDDIVKDVVDAHKDLCEKTALEFYAAVIEFTPVVTGRLRASWNISHTAPNLALDSALEAAHSSPEGSFSAPTIPQHIDGLPDFPKIFVTNPQPYAEYVNDGSPTNEPRQMVERAIQKVSG